MTGVTGAVGLLGEWEGVGIYGEPIPTGLGFPVAFVGFRKDCCCSAVGVGLSFGASLFALGFVGVVGFFGEITNSFPSTEVGLPELGVFGTSGDI